jgi:hypothetical protein
LYEIPEDGTDMEEQWKTIWICLSYVHSFGSRNEPVSSSILYKLQTVKHEAFTVVIVRVVVFWHVTPCDLAFGYQNFEDIYFPHL